ncbi:MAG: hypothetical protein QM713_08075 [Arachnia sp.]
MAGIVLAVLSSAGCTAPEAPLPPPPLTAEEQASFDSWYRYRKMTGEMQQMEDELIRRCMVAKGNRWMISSVPPNEGQVHKSLSVEEATKYGYSTVTISAAARAEDKRLEEFEASLTKAERDKQVLDVMGGPTAPEESVIVGQDKISYPKVGCRYEVQQKLYGDVAAWNELRFSIMVDAAEEIEESPEAKQAAKPWSSCMAAVNRHYKDPFEARSAGFDASTPGIKYEGPTPKEIEIAVADATCRAETGYDDAMQLIGRKAYAHAAMGFEGQILRLIELYTEAQKRGKELLG